MENRGGARKNTGPKPTARTVSDKFRKKLEAEMRKIAKETGKSVQRVALELAYDSEIQDSVRVGALKLIGEWSIVKESHSSSERTIQRKGPVILPAKKGDPADLDLEAAPLEEARH